jgi:hypothetical protein
MSPKVVNGSFAAIMDADEFLAKEYAGIRIAVSLYQLIIAELIFFWSNHLNNTQTKKYIKFCLFCHSESRFASDEKTRPRHSHVW